VTASPLLQNSGRRTKEMFEKPETATTSSHVGIAAKLQGPAVPRPNEKGIPSLWANDRRGSL